jgi:hypothetical protein
MSWAWRPQAGPQKSLVDCPVKEVFFGGTRGGGKTDGVLGKWALKEQQFGPGFNAIMFRKTTVRDHGQRRGRNRALARNLCAARRSVQRLEAALAHAQRRPRWLCLSRDGQDADQYQGRNVEL